MRILTRTVLSQCARLFAVYASLFLVVACIGFATPLVHRGAPLLDVLLFLPQQLAFPAMLVLPLALTTAILVTLGRMREDGEMAALMAAGISRWAVVRAMLPLVVVLAAAIGYSAHTLMPRSYQSLREGMIGLMQQAVGAQVQRSRPFFQQDDLTVGAAATDGDDLRHVFARQVSSDGRILISYADRARWRAHSEQPGSDTALRLALDQVTFVTLPAADEAEADPQVGTGRLWDMVIDLDLDRPDRSFKAESLSTGDLLVTMRRFEAIERKMLAAAVDLDRERFIHAVLPLADEPFTPELIVSPARLAEAAARVDDELGELGPSWRDSTLGQLLQTWRREPPSAESAVATLESLRGQIGDDLPAAAIPEFLQLANTLPWYATLSDEAKRGFDRLLLTERLSGGLRMTPALFAVGISHRRAWNRWAHDREPQAVPKTHEDVIEHQHAWHLRWFMPFAVLGLWVFAAGLGLAVSPRGRLIPVCLGVVTVLIAILPSIAAVKGMGENMPIHPAWLVWGPLIGLLGGGGWLCWRHR